MPASSRERLQRLNAGLPVHPRGSVPAPGEVPFLWSVCTRGPVPVCSVRRVTPSSAAMLCPAAVSSGQRVPGCLCGCVPGLSVRVRARGTWPCSVCVSSCRGLLPSHSCVPPTSAVFRTRPSVPTPPQCACRNGGSRPPQSQSPGQLRGSTAAGARGRTRGFLVAQPILLSEWPPTAPGRLLGCDLACPRGPWWSRCRRRRLSAQRAAFPRVCACPLFLSCGASVPPAFSFPIPLPCPCLLCPCLPCPCSSR